jgi:hypothetical protein
MEEDEASTYFILLLAMPLLAESKKYKITARACEIDQRLIY